MCVGIFELRLGQISDRHRSYYYTRPDLRIGASKDRIHGPVSPVTANEQMSTASTLTFKISARGCLTITVAKRFLPSIHSNRKGLLLRPICCRFGKTVDTFPQMGIRASGKDVAMVNARRDVGHVGASR